MGVVSWRMSMAVSGARWAAFRVLRRTELEAGFAADLLHTRFTAGLDERDAGLAEELVLGVLRWQGELDAVIAAAGGRPVETLDAEVRLALRLGLYQLRHLDRVPERAAVSESVEIVRRARKASAAGLVNAVLRRAAAWPPDRLPEVEWRVPGWLFERWRRHFGDAKAQALASATLDPPRTYLRLNARFDPDETVQLLSAEGVETEPTELPLCRRVRRGRPGRTACFRQGRIRLQDLGSQRVILLLDLGPGRSFLDLCAAPGGKTFQALERQPPGLSVACDRYHQRLLAMRRLATVPVGLVALDALRPLPFSRLFDRILVDAPCSGTGTLARNPEIKWRLAPADLEDLAARQQAILSQALQLLAPGGRLVYSTCSLEPEENQGVVAAALAPPFHKGEERLWLPCDHEGDGFYGCVITGDGRAKMKADRHS